MDYIERQTNVFKNRKCQNEMRKYFHNGNNANYERILRIKNKNRLVFQYEFNTLPYPKSKSRELATGWGLEFVFDVLFTKQQKQIHGNEKNAKEMRQDEFSFSCCFFFLLLLASSQC